jgi:hypothetical protein
LAKVLGFHSVADIDFVQHAVVATLRSEAVGVGLVVTNWGERLDPWWRVAVVQAGRRGACWCLLFNGTHIRLLNAARVFSRRFAEIDLDCAADDEKTSSAMRMLITAEALAGTTDLHGSSVDALVDLSDRHASDVCRSLRSGVLDASEHVLRALVARPHTHTVPEAFEQALTIVYRMLFLLFAEGRSLVPSWHPTYRSSYSLERLSERASRQESVGLWDALRAVAKLAHAGCRAGDLHVTPFNGRLFAPSNTPLADRRDLDDDAARRSLIALSTRPAADGEGRERIAYRDLGVEQLGAVYETLLDYTPRVERVTAPNVRRTPAIVSLQTGSGIRKATGTFYTPQPIAAYLIRETLQPLVRDATPEQILDIKVLDPSMGSGAFLVGACAYLGEAYEGAVAHGRCHPSDLGPRERAAIRRSIAERCLYGVDLNPMAVQLARLSLWLATLAVDRPLSFLDHHLQVGDSLLGAWISCLRRSPTDRRRRTASLPLLDELPVGDTIRDVLPIRFSLASEPNDTAAQVRTKERTLAALTDRNSALSKWKRVADLWCARWFASELHDQARLFATLSDAILTGRCAISRGHADHFLKIGEAAARAHRFFHWELEFPEVFFDADGQRRSDGGFDGVLGNPPWDMVRADHRTGDRQPERRQEAAAVVRFTRDAGVYDAQSDGHANRYQLFLERSLTLARPGGRIGLVLPAGLAADHGSARLRRMLLSRCDVDGLVGFENRKAIFPIHRSVRFLLLTGTTGQPTTSIGCRLREADTSILDRRDAGADRGSWFPVRLSPTLLHSLSGDDLSIPEVRSRVDLAIAERSAALFRPLGDSLGWSVRFGRELNATDDRQALQAGGRGLPIIEGKLIEPHRVRSRDARFSISTRDARRLLGTRHRRWRLAYRDVASATNRLTLIAALLPPGSVSTHTVFCLRTPLPLIAQRFLCGIFNSFVVNYLVRLRVTTHVTTAIVERLPIPREEDAGPAYEEVGAIARVLSRRDDPALESRLQATVGKLYQLRGDEFAHVLNSFPLIAQEDRDRAKEEFDRM